MAPKPEEVQTPLYTIENQENIVSASRQDFVNEIKHYYKVKKRLKWAVLFEFLALLIFIPGLVITASNNASSGVQMLFGMPMILDVLAIISTIIARLIYSIRGKVRAEYDFDENGQQYLSMLESAIACLKESKMLNRVYQAYEIKARTNGGASRALSTTPVKFSLKKPRFLKTKARCHYVKFRNEELYILPDMLIIVSKKAFSAIALKNLEINVSSSTYITSNPAKDANIIRYTWLYLNKDGSPDRRYKNNIKQAVTQCAVIDFSTKEGLNMRLQASNIPSVQKFADIVADMINRFDSTNNAESEIKTEIEIFEQLLQEGVITKEKFDSKKADILNNQ
ncbi:MAG: SHOCT domain-containing protein, partial [Oscillospiraceae bacterium]|nr:SHOCT domain-containing protein [Oscillospiraceae bacterium]